jgi:quinol-cytochrome oxidoreductase complex cytochrome b subunit
MEHPGRILQSLLLGNLLVNTAYAGMSATIVIDLKQRLDMPAWAAVLLSLGFGALAAGTALLVALIAFVVVLSIVFDAPLGDAANPGMSPNPAKAPWYFLGFQELLLHFDPVFAVVIIPVLALVGLFLLPYLRYDKDTSGIFMMSREGRRMGLVAAVTGVVATPLLIVADEYLINVGGWLTHVPPFVTNGLVSFGILCIAWAGFHTQLRKRYAASNNEMIQSSFILLAVAFVILTLTGIWFRGPGMALVWPWNR